MKKFVHLACEPIGKPDWLQGNVVVYTFTAEFIRWILDARQHAELAFGGPPRPEFCRAEFRVSPGRWLRSLKLPDDLEFDGEWVELGEAWQPDDKVASEGVPAAGWTIEIGTTDVVIHFREGDSSQELETPEIPYGVLADLLAQLEPVAPATVAAAVKPTAGRRSLWTIAQHYQRALNLSDPDHKDFADSPSDVVEFLWLKSALVRDTLAATSESGEPIGMGESATMTAVRKYAGIVHLLLIGGFVGCIMVGLLEMYLDSRAK